MESPRALLNPCPKNKKMRPENVSYIFSKEYFLVFCLMELSSSKIKNFSRELSSPQKLNKVLLYS